MKSSGAATATVAIAASIGIGHQGASGWSSRHILSPDPAITPRSRARPSRLRATPAEDEDASVPSHPHSRLWSNTLARSPNSHVHPAVGLTLRPPAEGGTGIVAKDDLSEGTVALSLRLEEVGMLDATSVLNNNETVGGDAVLNALKDTWHREPAMDSQRGQEGTRLAVLAGIVAHLQLTRRKDVAAASHPIRDGHALGESRRLGIFLDAMPLLPRCGDGGGHHQRQHPFPTHFLYWTDEEVQMLLAGTMGHTKAREIRAGTGLVVREFSAPFLAEHSTLPPAEVLDALLSAFAAVLSRSFGDAAGRDADGYGRMLVPLADMLNHDGEDPNVRWTWHVGAGDEDRIAAGSGDIAVTTLRAVRRGEELRKCYGWRPAWDIASSYGFVPRLERERWECAVVPLFPATLDLAPGVIPTPAEKARGATTLDLLLENNYRPLVQGVIAAVNAASEAMAGRGVEGRVNEEDADRPEPLKRLEVVSLFQQPPSGAALAAFPRLQPCVVVGTKIRSVEFPAAPHHRQAIEAVLPAFRAAASAIRQLRDNHRSSGNDSSAPVEASQMAIAAASVGTGSPWEAPALDLLREGMCERWRTLTDSAVAAEAWLVQQDADSGSEDSRGQEHRLLRAGVARDVRESELRVLKALQNTVEAMTTLE